MAERADVTSGERVGATSKERVGEEKPKETQVGFSKSASVVLLKPHTTEKTSWLAERGVYSFRVSPRATKQVLRQAVEELYKVNVEKVGIIYIPSRKRRLGRIIGRRPGYKKAIITLKKGQKIEFV
ncbi:50S ribosomal protein L23 [Patescibacteria group bacterium]|nr:50S ribosomal protein L23 [Patescibacteria group bacterium]